MSKPPLPSPYSPPSEQYALRGDEGRIPPSASYPWYAVAFTQLKNGAALYYATMARPGKDYKKKKYTGNNLLLLLYVLIQIQF